MKKHSLTRQITSIVSLLVAGAILLCWVLNTTLLPRYYMHNKKEVLIENYQTISNASAQNELESDEFAVTFDNLCSNGNIMALILQQDGKVLRSSVNDLDALRTEFWDVLLHGDKMEVLYSKLIISSMESICVSPVSSSRSLAIKAAPKAPMIPAISGRTA